MKMAKRSKKTRKTQEKRGTNWWLIGGVVFAGVVGLFALLFLAIQPPERQQTESQQTLTLAEYCSQNDGYCESIGEDSAPVTFIEVSDFGCPHCQTFHLEKSAPIQEQYVDTGLVKWVFLPYALRAATVPAANAALCAAEQGNYAGFTDALFDLPTEIGLTRDGFITAANEIDLDIDSFTTCLVDGRYNGTVAANQQAAQAAGVSGTPSFFINDQMITGNRPIEEFERIFDQIIGS